MSLQSGIFPAKLKEALITPLLKKTNLDVEELKNFRPVSNLPFVGKVIERAAINQLQCYINDNDFHSKNQSAYRCFHSVETATVPVTNDLLRAVDDHGEAVLVLLDLSAAFDTKDHQILLKRLSARYGVTGKAHQWFSSYLENRKQSVIIDDEISNPICLEEKVNFRSQILECPSIGQYWNIFGVPVLPENVILTFFRTC